MDLAQFPTTIIVGRHGWLQFNVVDLVMEAPTENVQQAKLATLTLMLVQKFLHQMETATTADHHGVLPMLNVTNHATEAPTRNVHRTKNAGQMPLLVQLYFHQQYQCHSVVLTLIHNCFMVLTPLVMKNKINS